MNENENYLVSKELLLLFKWICENNPELISQIVSKAWKKGFKNELKNSNAISIDDQIILQNAAFDFFEMMETCINKYKEDTIKKVFDLISEKVDYKSISNLKFREEDKEALALAFDKTKDLIVNNQINLDPLINEETIFKKKEKLLNKNLTINKDIFLNEFLKNWEPKDKILN